MNDNTTLGGTTTGVAPTGALTFTSSVGDLGANAPTASTFYATSPNTPALPARRSSDLFGASYAGDTNYNPIAAASNPETFFVDKGTLTLTTTVHDASHAVVANAAHIRLG